MANKTRGKGLIVTDYARLHPPFLSIVLGRKKPVQWHETEGGARRSALDTQSHYRIEDTSPPSREWVYRAASAIAIARLDTNGDVVIVEEWAEGDVITR